MKDFKVTFVRTVYETYEVEINCKDEEEVMEIILQGKYGKEIEGEHLTDTYSDDIEITEFEEVEEDEEEDDDE